MTKQKGNKRIALEFGLTIIIICSVTAIICALILFFPSCEKAEEFKYYAVGKKYADELSASTSAHSEINNGRAGLVAKVQGGHFLIYAIYTLKEDANMVAERLKAEVNEFSFSYNFQMDKQEQAYFQALCVFASDTEKLWRELDEMSTSESLVKNVLTEYALNFSRADSERLNTIFDELKTEILFAVASTDSLLSARVKKISALTVLRLSEIA